MGKDNRPPKHLRTLKRGDVREDGMVFWRYSPTYKNGEQWITPEKLLTIKDNRPPKHLRTLKRGDVREDGMIFWSYAAQCKNGEQWITPSEYKKRKQNKVVVKDNRPPPHLRTHKRGDVREDGMVFWEYSACSKNGEIWFTESDFNEKRKRRRDTHYEYIKQRLISDENYRIVHNLRGRIRAAIKGDVKTGSSIDLLGCPIDTLKRHLESQFTEGMTWDNYGFYGWHIDHIKPCASFDLTLDEEQKKCFHYSNLQPLWAKDNLQKGDRQEPMFL